MLKKIVLSMTAASGLIIAGCAQPFNTAPAVNTSQAGGVQQPGSNVQIGVVNSGQPLSSAAYNPNNPNDPNAYSFSQGGQQLQIEGPAPVAPAPVNNAASNGGNSLSGSRDTLGEQQQEQQAIASLQDRAADAVGSGNLDQAAGALEQALRIEPNNASIWHDLSQVRMHQRQFDQAIAMAQRSISYSANNNSLKSRNWNLIAIAYRAQGNESAAQDADARAASFQ